jgi:uncharacterized protein YaaN involved in tellurite resistance
MSQSSVFSLDLDVARTRTDIDLAEIEAEAESLAALRERAEIHVEHLLSLDPADHDAREASRLAVDEMGRDLERRTSTRSRMLQAPLRDMSRGTEDGGPVATSLADLRVEVDRLDPTHLNTDTNWFMSLVGKIPGVGTPLRRYFLRYENSQVQIDAIVRSLENSRDQLSRDNITLADDQREMRDLTTTLAEQITFSQAIDRALVDRLANEIRFDQQLRDFVNDEILFTVRQRTLDLQQQLTVSQQALMATEIIIRNNRELIRGVDRSINVTISALQVAVTVALALERQQLVLDKIEAINATTSTLIAGTAQRLQTQGTSIHRQAASSMLDMDALRSAFSDIEAALNEVTRYRRDALPKMETQVRELDRLAADNDRTMDRMDIGQTPPDRPGATPELGETELDETTRADDA